MYFHIHRITNKGMSHIIVIMGNINRNQVFPPTLAFTSLFQPMTMIIPKRFPIHFTSEIEKNSSSKKVVMLKYYYFCFWWVI
ncbi:hypothetical protein KSS87_010862 [Heliosperma pusillum]|nr:hypothetical protein KSS87_011107 [Heliosperma pusillum]KAH9613273.1 hypothetical protein KSS87_010862 [Heliosperma pusillum]